MYKQILITALAISTSELVAAASKADGGVNALYERWERSFADGDKALLDTTYTSDAVFLGGEANKPILIGRAAVVAPMHALIDRSKTDGTKIDFRFRVVKRDVQSDVATDAGYYRIVMTPTQPGMEPRRVYGKFVVVAVRQPDGQWAARFDAASGAPAEAYETASPMPGLKFDP